MHDSKNVATNCSQSSFISVVYIFEKAITKNYIVDPCDQLITTIKGGGPEMCCHTDDKHEHAHEHPGEKHAHEHIHDGEHKHGHKCCH